MSQVQHIATHYMKNVICLYISHTKIIRWHKICLNKQNIGLMALCNWWEFAVRRGKKQVMMIFRNFKIALMREVRVWVYKDGTWSHCCRHCRQLHDTFLVLLMVPCDKFGLLPLQTSALIWRAFSVATTDVLTFFHSFRIQQKRCKHCGGKLTKQASRWNTVLCLCSAQCTVCCRFWPTAAEALEKVHSCRL